MTQRKIFAIGDLHMDGGQNKPMDVFGSHWENHFERIAKDWHEKVTENDIVLLPGDISWAMYLDDAKADLNTIGSLPGQKILLKGNHDYWWSSIGKVRELLPGNMQALQNDCIVLDECVIAGSRGWLLPTKENPLKPEDDKIYRRELMRMDMSLQSAVEKGGDRPILVMMHYPPLNELGEESEFTKLFSAYGAQKVVYGHLHGASAKNGFCGKVGGVEYQMVSADGLQFQLIQVL